MSSMHSMRNSSRFHWIASLLRLTESAKGGWIDATPPPFLQGRVPSIMTTRTFAALAIAASILAGCAKPSAQEQLAQQVLDAKAKAEAMPSLQDLQTSFNDFIQADLKKRPDSQFSSVWMIKGVGVDDIKQSSNGYEANLTSDPIAKEDSVTWNRTTYTYSGTYTAKDKASGWTLTKASVIIKSNQGESKEQLK